MNIAYVQMDETGVYVEGAGHAPVLTENMIAVPLGVKPEMLLRHYILDGAFSPRPIPPEPVEIEGGWRLAACPALTQIFIHDVDGGEVIFEGVIEADGDDFDFALSDAGHYIIEVDAPLPFVDTKTLIEVA